MDQLPDNLDLPDQIQILEAVQGTQKILKTGHERIEVNNIDLS